jgi:hypothetical protein
LYVDTLTTTCLIPFSSAYSHCFCDGAVVKILKYLKVEITLGIVGIYICNAPALFSNLLKVLREALEMLSGKVFSDFAQNKRELVGNM